MKRYRLDPKKPRQLTKSDLARLDRMKDSDIDYSDIPPLDDEFFKKAMDKTIHKFTDFDDEVSCLWFKCLRRRGQRRLFTWKKMKTCIKRYLPPPRIVHPWPSERFDVRGLVSPT